MSHTRRIRFWGLALGLLALLFGGAFLNEFPGAPAPERKTGDNIDPEEHPNAQVPLDLSFVDSSGTAVTLKELFDGSRPVILTMNYSNCPRLCSLQLNGLVHGLAKLDWDLGDKYTVITVSIDPDETTERAQKTKEKYLGIYGRSGAEDGWHFLTGREENIRALADAVGFRYKYEPETKQYAHTAVTMVCTPSGRVSRYLYGIDAQFQPQTLRMSLLEAGEGKIGTTLERVLLSCAHYDSTTGKYTLTLMRALRWFGLVTLVAVGGFVILYWRRGSRREARRAVGVHASACETTDVDRGESGRAKA